MTGTGTQTDPYIVTTWDEFLAAIAQDGVYVNLAETYTWNLDEIYADSVIPSEIPIGYNTVVDGKDSVVTSAKVDGFHCDFSGDNATIKHLRFLLWEHQYVYHYNIYLIDDPSEVLSLPYEPQTHTRWKIKPNLVVDLNERNSGFDWRIPVPCSLLGNNMILKNSRDLHIKAFYNASSWSYGYRQSLRLWHINLIDNVCLSNGFFGWEQFNGSLPIYELSESTCKVVLGQGVNLKELGSERYVNTYRSNITVIGLGTGANINETYFKDCNVYGENVFFMLDIDSSYITGTTNNSDCSIKRVVYSILEIKNITDFSGSVGNVQAVVYNSDLSPGIRVLDRITPLTTEEIRNPQKLFDAGIPINPTGG